MNETMAVFRREVAARRDLFLLAAAVLVIVLMMPLVPGTGNYSPTEIRGVASQVLALLLGCGLAIGLGLSVFGSDLSAGRLGFFFARPVAARSIWVGRILAAIAIALVCELVVIIPAVVENSGRLIGFHAKSWWAIACAFVLLPTILCLASHALSVMNRARTAWLVLDLVGLVACTVGSWIVIRPLYVLGAAWAVFVVGGVLAVAVGFALAVAGCSGLAVGRTDLRRMHAALSVTLWSLLGAAVIGLAFYGGWLRGFGPAEMDDVDVFSVAPDGEWIEVWGGAPWRLDVRRRLLISSTGDRHIMLPMSSGRDGLEMVYSPDGGTAVGITRISRSESLTSLWWVDLTSDVPKLTETLLVVPKWTLPALSPDGSRVALLEDGTLSVYDLASEELVTAVRLPAPYRKATLLFFERDRLRLFARPGGDEALITLIAEVNLESGKFFETGRIESGADARWMAIDSGAARMIFCVREDRAPVSRCALRDARDGSLIREFDHNGPPRFLDDGRLVFLIDDPVEGTRLLVESADGETRIERALANAAWEDLGGEALAGRVVVGHLDDLDKRTHGRRYDLIAVDGGETRPMGDGLRRAHRGFQWIRGGGGLIRWNVDSPESNRMFTDRTGAVVRWDPETGDLVHIIGGRQE
jgi:hypothetical protein